MEGNDGIDECLVMKAEVYDLSRQMQLMQQRIGELNQKIQDKEVSQNAKN